jgi:hypothetical protein
VLGPPRLSGHAAPNDRRPARGPNGFRMLRLQLTISRSNPGRRLVEHGQGRNPGPRGWGVSGVGEGGVRPVGALSSVPVSSLESHGWHSWRMPELSLCRRLLGKPARNFCGWVKNFYRIGAAALTPWNLWRSQGRFRRPGPDPTATLPEHQVVTGVMMAGRRYDPIGGHRCQGNFSIG